MAATVLFLAGPGGVFYNEQILFPDGGTPLKPSIAPYVRSYTDMVKVKLLLHQLLNKTWPSHAHVSVTCE